MGQFLSKPFTKNSQQDASEILIGIRNDESEVCNVYKKRKTKKINKRTGPKILGRNTVVYITDSNLQKF